MRQKRRQAPQHHQQHAIFLIGKYGGGHERIDRYIDEPQGQAFIEGLSGRITPRGKIDVMLYDGNLQRPSWPMCTIGMLMPLDFIWVSETGAVVDILEDVEPDLDPVGGGHACRFVIEATAGFVAALGLKIGDVVQFPDDRDETEWKLRPKQQTEEHAAA